MYEEIKNTVAQIEGWISDREARFLYSGARNCAASSAIVEIGSWKGKSTVILAKGSQQGNKTKVFAIDPHQDELAQKQFSAGKSTLAEFQQNIKSAKVDELVVPIIKKSAEAFVGWDKPIGLLWIDGDHSYVGAKQDFDLWSRHLVPGAVVAFHDAVEESVSQVAWESFSRVGFSHIGMVDSIAYATKSHATKGAGTKSLKDQMVLAIIKHYPKLRKIKLLRSVRGSLKKLLAGF